MDQVRRYLFEGVVIDIPLRYDEQADMYIEEYPDFTEKPVYSPSGNPVMFAGEDACRFGESETREKCLDCGGCRYYRRAAEHTLIGICKHENNKKLT